MPALRTASVGTVVLHAGWSIGMRTATWFQDAARTSLRGGAADVAIQGFCLRVVDAAEESERMELDCRVAALLAMTGWGGAGGLRGWGGEGRGAEHADPGPHGGFAPPRVAESIIGNAALNQEA